MSSALLTVGPSMIAFTECPREIAMKEPERCLDPQLWHACAGGMVQMPALSSLVCYFPQGQAEHAQSPVEFPVCPRLPPYILCRVAAVKYLADPDTDEVYAKMKLLPVRSEELDYAVGDLGSNGSAAVPEKTASFAKTLTQSDANNGGGFSVPRYCAETIFPRLDYSADPPVQTIMARDVHGEIWKFRHIYRGTPRRHLLTTGWSTFVNQKKLVAGDSIVFLRSESGELCVGIRRAKRGPGGGLELPSGWNVPGGNCLPPSYAGFSLFLREQENKLMRRSDQGGGPMGGRVRAESVIEASRLAASGQLFEVVYYPRASTPEFCVKAAAVRASLRIDWCAGLRFKMAFETEDSSRISWFMGTVSSVQCADPLRWPDSPWRLLQVTWDEPDLLQNVKRVSPWLVEVVSSMPGIHLKSFSPSRKKLRLPPAPELGDGRLMAHVFGGGSFEPSSNPQCCLPDSVPSGIQGARHSQFGISISDLQISKLQTGLIRAGFHRPPPPVVFSGVGDKSGSPNASDDVSCLLTIGNAAAAASSPCLSPKTPHFVLFGQPILTDTPPSSGEESPEPTKKGGSDLNVAGWYEDKGLDQTGHCKVFLESENVGRTLDLSVLGSYEELYRRLADMFGIHKADVKCHVLYRDATGAVKHTGDEAFTDFMKTARRLQILMDAGSDNLGR